MEVEVAQVVGGDRAELVEEVPRQPDLVGQDGHLAQRPQRPSGGDPDRDRGGDAEVDALVGHVDGVDVADAPLPFDAEQRVPGRVHEVEVDRQERDLGEAPHLGLREADIRDGLRRQHGAAGGLPPAGRGARAVTAAAEGRIGPNALLQLIPVLESSFWRRL